MSVLRRVVGLVGVVVVGVAIQAGSAAGGPGDTTWVNTFSNDLYNWATPHEQTFTFPAERNWRKVLLRYHIGCPPTPDDCDPWDRIGYLRVMREVAGGAPVADEQLVIEPVEIARIITPYDITGPNRPGTCDWFLDVSDYQSLLHGEVTLNNYIESWIGGTRGWLVTIDFAFIEGEPELIPYKVTNLWNQYYAVYGDPTRPIEDVLAPVDVAIDAEAISAKVKVTTTGHGQGNSQNCAEFCNKQHTVTANATNFTHNLWRNNCAQNPCGPQGGTWTNSRAGWCPGDKVDPWEVDVTGLIVAGATSTFDYSVQAYTNFCCPCNPGCISGATCANCNYDSNGHTEPIYAVASQLIQYKTNLASDVATLATPTRAVLEQNVPNPVQGSTEIRYQIESPGRVRLDLYDASGRVVRVLAREHQTAGSYTVRWDGRDASGDRVPAGVYFYSLASGAGASTKKMLLLE